MAEAEAATAAAINANAVSVAIANAAENEARAVAEAAEAADAEAVADAADLAEVGEQGAAASAASAEYRGSSARDAGLVGVSERDAASPFSKVDEQITDAIILLNRLPNAIERQASNETNRVTQKAERSRQWTREHETELMRRAEVNRQILSLHQDLR